jgi:hypothetical protein
MLGMPNGRAISPHSEGKPRDRLIDEVLAELAACQHGVVGRAQLLVMGFGPRAIEFRLRRRRLHRVFRGAYSPSPIVSGLGRWKAATLAIGPDAVLSYVSGGALWAMRPSSSRIVDLTVPRTLGRREGFRLHRSRLPDDERTEVEGIPVTTPGRTLLDLAGVLTWTKLEQAVVRAGTLRLTHTVPLDALLLRYPRRPGIASLRRVLAEGSKGVAEPGIEERFLALIDELGLPRPELNVWLALGDRWIKADCLWREQRLLVELDSRSHHDTAPAFESDRDRDRRALVAGWNTIRVTWRMLEREADELERDLCRLLAAGPQLRAA